MSLQGQSDSDGLVPSFAGFSRWYANVQQILPGLELYDLAVNDYEQRKKKATEKESFIENIEVK